MRILISILIFLSSQQLLALSIVPDRIELTEELAEQLGFDFSIELAGCGKNSNWVVAMYPPKYLKYEHAGASISLHSEDELMLFANISTGIDIEMSNNVMATVCIHPTQMTNVELTFFYALDGHTRTEFYLKNLDEFLN